MRAFLLILAIAVAVHCASTDNAFASMQRAVSEMRDASGRTITASKSPIDTTAANAMANAQTQAAALQV